MDTDSIILDPPREIVEALGNSITRTWLFDRRIVVYAIGAVARPSIDTWVEAVMSDAQAWPEQKPYLALYDFAIGTFTPYGGKRSLEMVKAIPSNLHGRVAVLIAKSIFGQIIKNFVINRVNQLIPGRQTEFFFDYDEALRWLQQGFEA